MRPSPPLRKREPWRKRGLILALPRGLSAEYPPCGCRLSTSGKGGEVAGAAAGAGTNFTQARGFLLDGNDLAVGNYTWVAAAKACSRDSTCAGFSFDNVHDVNNSKSGPGMRKHECLNLALRCVLCGHDSVVVALGLTPSCFCVFSSFCTAFC